MPSRQDCPDQSKWDTGIERVYPLEERRRDRERVPQYANLLRRYTLAALPHEAVEADLARVIDVLHCGRKEMSDLIDYVVLLTSCNTTEPMLLDLEARTLRLLDDWMDAEQCIRAFLASVDLSMRSRLLGSEGTFVPLTNVKGINPIASHVTRVGQLQTQIAARVGELIRPLSGQQRDYQASQLLIGGYQHHQGYFVDTFRAIATQEVARAKLAGLTYLQYLTQHDGVPNDLPVRWNKVVRQHLPIFRRFLAWLMRKQQYQSLPITALVAEPMHHGVSASFLHTFEEVLKASAPLGPDYQAAIQEMRDQHRLDYCPYGVRQQGSYVCFLRGKPFAFFNLIGSHYGKAAVAHELAHAAHLILSDRGRPFEEFGVLAAEVVALVGEQLYFERSLRTAGEGEAKTNLLMDEMRTTIVRVFMPSMWSEFELSAYEHLESGGSLKSEWLCNRLATLLQEYCGPIPIANFVNVGVLWPIHFILFFQPQRHWLYGPAHALGIDLYEALTGGDDSAVTQYIEFLRRSDNFTSSEGLLSAGVDLNSDEHLHAAFRRMEVLMDEIEQSS